MVCVCRLIWIVFFFILDVKANRFNYYIIIKWFRICMPKNPFIRNYNLRADAKTNADNGMFTQMKHDPLGWDEILTHSYSHSTHHCHKIQNVWFWMVSAYDLVKCLISIIVFIISGKSFKYSLFGLDTVSTTNNRYRIGVDLRNSLITLMISSVCSIHRHQIDFVFWTNQYHLSRIKQFWKLVALFYICTPIS